jgi:hypothetical protein
VTRVEGTATSGAGWLVTMPDGRAASWVPQCDGAVSADVAELHEARALLRVVGAWVYADGLAWGKVWRAGRALEMREDARLREGWKAAGLDLAGVVAPARDRDSGGACPDCGSLSPWRCGCNCGSVYDDGDGVRYTCTQRAEHAGDHIDASHPMMPTWRHEAAGESWTAGAAVESAEALRAMARAAVARYRARRGRRV